MPPHTATATGPAFAATLREPGPGLVVLDPVRATLLTELDALFTGLAELTAAAPVVGPPLLPAEGLARLDYFRNFPHLGVAAARFRDEALDALAAGDAVEGQAVRPTGYLLPSATCYGLLLSLAAQDIGTELRVTAVGRCFRNEDHYDGLRRLWGFHMREVLYLGSADGARTHLADSKVFVEELADRLGVPLSYRPANDPFYDKSGSRAKLMALDPVKYEFTAEDGTAIASVNRHRNFFGERLDITADGQTAHSSCTAFGVERWVHAMVLSHGSPEAALERVRAVRGGAVGGDDRTG
ncbi:aminoacyl--tRNA ligase-related protein [Kitasatospora sp. NPDC048365]|uniref:aminoacyl--tRNA ligase-related protein n=1 Tax=Kitasatospora sp. NPDC048365 TaxID=3364050 RepID=UPI0037156548